MKKLLIPLLAIVATGCAEKAEYEQAVLEQMKSDKDIADYNISPETMVECVVITSSREMPGLVPFDPDRKQAYLNYTKMLKLTGSSDPQKELEALRAAFGSPKALADAHANYAESVVECLSGLVTGTEESIDKTEGQ
jgi:hypothetical protein